MGKKKNRQTLNRGTPEELTAPAAAEQAAEDIKEAVRRSFDIKCFMPEDTAVWNENYERFREITE